MMQQKQNGIASEMKTARFVHSPFYMLDYSSILAKCSKHFQFEDIFVTSVIHIWQSKTTDILKLKVTPGNYTNSLQEELTSDDKMTFMEIQLSKSQRGQLSASADSKVSISGSAGASDEPIVDAEPWKDYFC